MTKAGLVFGVVLFVVGFLLLLFGASRQTCEACVDGSCNGPPAIDSCSSIQYFVSPFQSGVYMEPVIFHWNYDLNLFGLAIMVVGLILGLFWRRKVSAGITGGGTGSGITG